MPLIYGNCELKGFMSKCDLKTTTKSPSWWGFFFNDFFLSALSPFFSPASRLDFCKWLQCLPGGQTGTGWTSSCLLCGPQRVCTSSSAVAAIVPDEGWTLEPVCSPHPDERQLWTGFGLFCLKSYHGLPCEWECKEKSQIKPELYRLLRQTLFGPYVLQVHFIGMVNWSEIRARF